MELLDFFSNPGNPVLRSGKTQKRYVSYVITDNTTYSVFSLVLLVPLETSVLLLYRLGFKNQLMWAGVTAKLVGPLILSTVLFFLRCTKSA